MNLLANRSTIDDGARGDNPCIVLKHCCHYNCCHSFTIMLARAVSLHQRRVLGVAVAAGRCGKTSTTTTVRALSSSSSSSTKAGTPIPGLAIFKEHDPPVVQTDYPAWFQSLTQPQPSLAQLRRMPNEEAEEKDILRFLKLQRRQQIRQQNEEAGV
jgi:Mitochondrial ribosomal protein L37